MPIEQTQRAQGTQDDGAVPSAVREQVLQRLDRVEDPEIAVTLRDLGVLRDVHVQGTVQVAHVRVRLVPTRLGCPATAEMTRRVRAAVHAAAPDAEVEVVWDLASWQPGDISPCGRRTLRAEGYAALDGSRPVCPYCGSADVRRDGEFGGAVCRTPFTCLACGTVFDALRSALPLRPLAD